MADFCWLSEQDVLSGLLGGPWLFLTVLWASLYGKLCIWLSRIYCKASFTKMSINQIVWKAVRRGNTKRKRSCLALLRNNHCLSSCFWVKTASTFKWVWQTKCATPVWDMASLCPWRISMISVCCGWITNIPCWPEKVTVLYCLHVPEKPVLIILASSMQDLHFPIFPWPRGSAQALARYLWLPLLQDQLKPHPSAAPCGSNPRREPV